MLQKKICMLGAFSVGKTSLVQRFVSSMFDDKYLTTIGVKIDKKLIVCDNTDVTLMLWDLAGEDEYNSINPSYLRGAAGCILVVDGTRPKTLEVALEIKAMTETAIGQVPLIAALNKADLKADWLIESTDLEQLAVAMPIIETSAKTELGVEEMFQQLTQNILSSG
jgi:small GTP-binding protein